jgi:hypothetical protein
MLTFGDLRDPTGDVARAAGLDPCSEDFRAYCLSAVRQLIRRGNWFSTVYPMRGCIRDRTVTWPRGVGTILALNVCERPSQLANRWYQFMPLDSSHVRDGLHYNRHGWAGNLITEETSTSPVFNPIKSAGMLLQFNISQAIDAGKTITIYGIDQNGQTIRTKWPDGVFRDGVQIVLAAPFVQSPFSIRHVTRVVKQVTAGFVNVYQFNPIGSFLLDLAQYEATETNPDYIVSRIIGARDRNWEQCSNHVEQVSALVKMNFVPFHDDGDLVQIDCEDAIANMVLSIRCKEEKDLSNAATYEAAALRELNKQIQDRFPIEQFQVSYRPYGSARLQKVTGGFI